MVKTICPICLENLHDERFGIAVVTNCGHGFHRLCLEQACQAWCQQNKKMGTCSYRVPCPVCQSGDLCFVRSHKKRGQHDPVPAVIRGAVRLHLTESNTNRPVAVASQGDNDALPIIPIVLPKVGCARPKDYLQKAARADKIAYNSLKKQASIHHHDYVRHASSPAPAAAPPTSPPTQLAPPPTCPPLPQPQVEGSVKRAKPGRIQNLEDTLAGCRSELTESNRTIEALEMALAMSQEELDQSHNLIDEMLRHSDNTNVNGDRALVPFVTRLTNRFSPYPPPRRAVTPEPDGMVAGPSWRAVIPEQSGTSGQRLPLPNNVEIFEILEDETDNVSVGEDTE